MRRFINISLSNSGQALVENILIIPILVVTIVMLFWFADLMLTKQQLVMAARYGTDLISYSNMNQSQVRNEIRDYLCGKDVQGRRLDPAKLKDDNINVHFPDKKFSTSNPCAYLTLIDQFTNTLGNTSYVEVYYDFDTPKLFSAWSSYIGGDKILKKLRIGARSEVLAGTGCKGG